jgi:glycerophosphoryl diester phosphodiesterase
MMKNTGTGIDRYWRLDLPAVSSHKAYIYKNYLPTTTSNMKRRIKKVLLVMSIPLFIFLLFTVLIPFLVFSFASAQLPAAGKTITIVGHRGAAGLAPENTLASFRKALEIGVDMVELDVHLSKDDSVIVMHDYNVRRTTNGKGDIEDLTSGEIAALDAGSWYGDAFKNEKVPQLRDVLQLVNGRAKVLIEFKWPARGIYTNLVKRVLQTVREFQAESWVILQSFETKYLEEIHQDAPSIECHQLLFGRSSILPVYFDRSLRLGRFKEEPYVKSVNLFYLYLNKGFSGRLHDKGIQTFVYTIDSRSKMAKAVNLGADGIITNRPDIAVELFRKH